MAGEKPLTRLLVPALFAIAAMSIAVRTGADVGHALAHHGARPWLIAAYDALRTCVVAAFAFFTAGRAKPVRNARSPIAFVACAAAMATILAFARPAADTPEGMLVGGELLALAACVWLLVSVLFLGRCFGVLPEARGLVTSGPYRLVRHPVYLGEICACTGLALAAPRAGNVIALSVVIAAQFVRMRLEERALTDAFPEYADYAARTGRLLPRLPLRWNRIRHGSPATSSTSS
jgi:protein-S-isoprenylcysteine O-methyltransferase Ste14